MGVQNILELIVTRPGMRKLVDQCGSWKMTTLGDFGLDWLF
jgi:hypothetical protein